MNQDSNFNDSIVFKSALASTSNPSEVDPFLQLISQYKSEVQLQSQPQPSNPPTSNSEADNVKKTSIETIL